MTSLALPRADNTATSLLRRSFAYSNAYIENRAITQELVTQLAMKTLAEPTAASRQRAIYDRSACAMAEAYGSLSLWDSLAVVIANALERTAPFALEPSVVLGLHATAVRSFRDDGGRYRSVAVQINGSRHRPPAPGLVGAMVADLCDEMNSRVYSDDPLTLAAYVMWKFNWIHPFEDGNGRTSRALCYLVLCIGLRMQLPGSVSLLTPLAEDPDAYYSALEQADDAHATGREDVSGLRRILERGLALQLQSE